MNRRKIEFLKERRAEQQSQNENKIELLSCNLEKLKCTEHLKEINKNYSKAGSSHLEKNYSRSIKSLKKAYLKASELKNEASCRKCVTLFQDTIGQSLNNINKELHNMTHGIFGKEKLKPCYIESRNVLHELKGLR